MKGPQANDERAGRWLQAPVHARREPSLSTETMDMTTRRKTPNRPAMAALSLAAALAVQTGSALAQPIDDTQPVKDEIEEYSERGIACDVIWCWPLHWLIPCWVG